MGKEKKSPETVTCESPMPHPIYTETSNMFQDNNNDLQVSSRIFTTTKIRHCAISPVGLFGFAFACFTTGLGNLELIQYSQVTIVAYFIFGGILQYVIGVLDWVQGNSLNAMLSILFGGYNISCLFWDYFADKQYAPKYSGDAFGIFNLIWMIMMIAPSIAVWNKGSKVAFVNYVLVILVCFLNMLSGFTSSKVFKLISGIDYFIISIITSYIGFAVILNGTYGKTLFPLFSKGENCVWIKRQF